MRILILDSNTLFATGIKYLLEALLPGTQAECVTCCAEAMARLKAMYSGLLVMEIGTAKDNGLRVLKRLRAEYPNLPILVLSDYPVEYYGARVIRAGACGVLPIRATSVSSQYCFFQSQVSSDSVSARNTTRGSPPAAGTEPLPSHPVQTKREPSRHSSGLVTVLVTSRPSGTMFVA